MSKHKIISQREAYALKRRVAELEAAEDNRRNAWIRDYPGGTRIHSMGANGTDIAIVRTARKLGHAVVCNEVNGVLNLYALPLSTKAYEEAMG